MVTSAVLSRPEESLEYFQSLEFLPVVFLQGRIMLMYCNKSVRSYLSHVIKVL